MNNDAQALFEQGVQALRERKDRNEARKLLTQSLRLNPQNDMAWLWLSQTISDPQKRLKCVQSALDINPRNQKALTIKHKLWSQYFAIDAEAPIDEEEKPEEKPGVRTLTTQDQKRIAVSLKRAEACLDKEDPEGAIEQWVAALNIEPDNEVALRNAVKHLYRLQYPEDAEELVWRAIDAGTQKPSVYLTGIDIARKNYDHPKVDALYEDLVKLPDPEGRLLGMAIDHFIDDDQPMRAEALLKEAIEKHPNSPKLLRQMGDLQTLMENKEEAHRYYDRAARVGAGTAEGRAAEKLLGDAPAVLTDRERGSLVLAVRETLGFGLFFVMLGWQDAGLNFARLGSSRLLGIILSLVGGYLVITATSSPQQQPIAKWLGGRKPRKPKDEDGNGMVIGSAVSEETELPMIGSEVRVILGMVGLVVLGVAFWMVFSTAIHLLFNPAPVIDLPTVRDVFWPEVVEIYYGG
jgi:tetratricopeptide (TPR) repeat protein